MKSYHDIDPSIWKIIFKVFDSIDIEPNIVDVGARNGMFILPNEYAKNSSYIGFEPNTEEYNKLINEKSSSLQFSKKINFKKEKYLNTALWNKKCKKRFYITSGVGASTLMGETNKLTDKMYLQNSINSYREEHTAISKTESVKCNTLNNIFKNYTIDFLKLDTEGSELSILQGGSNLLKKQNILMIKTEFVFFKYYKDHKIFGDIHKFLDNYGYRLIFIDQDQPKYSPIESLIPKENDKGLTYAGDAYFCIDFVNKKISKQNSLRLAAISLALGYNNLGFYFLKKSELLSQKEIKIIIKSLKKVSLLRKFVDLWKLFPSIIYNRIKK